MSDSLAVRAEIVKLARLLGRDPGQLEYLHEVPAPDIHQLREQITDVLFSAQNNTLRRLAAASRLLPVGLVATIGQRAFGPMLSARVAGMLDPDRAVEMAARLPIAFLADIAVEIDPRRASDVIAKIPPDQIAAVTRELSGREEYVTIGRFVGHVPSQSISAALEVLDDGSLLRTAFVMEAKGNLEELIGLLPSTRIDGIIDAAASQQLWPEALDLLSHLNHEQRADFANRVAARDPRLLEEIARTAEAYDALASDPELRKVVEELLPGRRLSDG
jgi:hypothetical protein